MTVRRRLRDLTTTVRRLIYYTYVCIHKSSNVIFRRLCTLLHANWCGIQPTRKQQHWECMAVSRRSHDRPTTVAWTFSELFQNFFRIAWNVEKTLFDSRSTVAWTQTTVAWPFSDFFQKFCKRLETSKKRCLTVSRRSRDLRPLSRDGSAILSNFSELLDTSKKRYLTVVQQSRDLRPLSRDRSVTFFKKFPNSLKRLKTLFDCHPTVAWPPTTVAWPSVTFFKIFPNCLKRLKNVVWQSSNGRVTSDHCRVTFSDFFRNFSELLETSKKRWLTVIQRSRYLRPLSRDLQWLFSMNFRIAWNVWKRCLTVIQRLRDLRLLSRDLQ